MTTLESEIAASLWAERTAAFLATFFSAAAAVIVAAGLYALITFTVMQRRREIGIRVALGALPRNVVGLMLARAALLATAGIALGLVVARRAASEISAILYEVKPHDSTALLAAAAVAFAVTAIAVFIPALGAARIDPASVLREQ